MTIEERLKRVENQGFWLKIGEIALLAGVVATAIWRSGRLSIDFRMSGAGDKPRMVAELTEDGTSVLVFRDKDGVDRMALGCRAEGSAFIRFVDANGVDRAVLGISPEGHLSGDGSGVIQIEDHSTRVQIGLGGVVGPGLEVLDSDGLVRLSLGGHSPQLILYDGNGKPRMNLDALEGLQPSIALFDEDGQDRVRITLTKEGDPHVALRDQNRRAQCVIGTIGNMVDHRIEETRKTEGCRISLLDAEEGTLRWQAPSD